MKKLLSESIASGVIRASGLGLSLLLSVVMARALAPSGYGVYGFVLSVVALLTIPVKFGVPILVVRETARAIGVGENALVWALWRWAHGFIFFASAIICIGISVWLMWGWVQDAVKPKIWIWGMLLVPLLAFAHLRSASIRGLGYSLLSQVPESLIRPALIIAMTCITIIFGIRLSADLALLFNVVATAISFTIGMVLMLTRAPVRPKRPSRTVSKSTRRYWLVASMTLGVALGAQALGANTDVVFLGIMDEDSEVGLYKVALNGASLISFGLQSVNIILMTKFAVLYRSGAIEELQNVVTAAARIVLLFTLLACALLGFFGAWLIGTLFGPQYHGAYVVLLIIGAGQLMSALFGSVVLLLNMTGHEKDTLIGTVGFALINILLNAVLIPLFGKEGAALATAMSLIAFNGYLWFVAWRKLRVNTLAFGTALLRRIASG